MSRCLFGERRGRLKSTTSSSQKDLLMAAVKLKEFSWERMIAAVDAVRERARRMATALDQLEEVIAKPGDEEALAWVDEEVRLGLRLI